MLNHLLVTNDFPPKIGGIQSYLWELWRRLPPDRFTVLTTPHADAAAFDAAQPFEVRRSAEPWLLPRPGMAGRVDRLAVEVGAEAVILDPALPIGRIGPQLAHPYGVVLHGAEVTVPGRLAGVRGQLRTVLRGADLVIAAGTYPLAEAERAAGCKLPAVVVPPGVDTDRFHPLAPEAVAAARAQFGLGAGPLVVSVSRLVPRKGMDTLLAASARLRGRFPELQVAIAGSGRDRSRLERLAERVGAPVRFLGRVDDDALPLLYGCADAFAMLCRTRWGGLEQEGFGIVFVEAGACGVPVVGGASGGVADAITDGETGYVIDPATDVEAVAEALGRLLGDESMRVEMGRAGRSAAVHEYGYDRLAARLEAALAGPELGIEGPSG
ncbi:MAG: glycosyltransferase family 4 protein [Acidimicrobiales bacterium]|nr:glycosyltransferase family 4 protein [Acidimicrobiales bacterium]